MSETDWREKSEESYRAAATPRFTRPRSISDSSSSSLLSLLGNRFALVSFSFSNSATILSDVVKPLLLVETVDSSSNSAIILAALVTPVLSAISLLSLDATAPVRGDLNSLLLSLPQERTVCISDGGGVAGLGVTVNTARPGRPTADPARLR